MGPRAFLYGASTFFLLCGKALASTEAAPEQNPSYELVSTKSGACLTEINAAREHAGLTAFAQATATGPDDNLPLDNAAQLWRLPCDPLASEGEVSKTKNELFFRTAFAYLQLPSATPNCTEAVDHWKAAFTNFKDYDLPPANDLTTQLYSTRDNTSFVAIYNPAKNATIDCRVSTCTKTTVSQPQPDGEGEPVRTQESAHSLLCLPTPDILTLHGDPPFTKEEWEKIKSSFTQSGSAGRFNFSAAFFALATLLGVAALW